MHNLFLVYFVNFYTFRACLGPSSGGTNLCIQQLVLILFQMTACCSGWIIPIQLGQQSSKKNSKYQLLYT